MATVFVFNTYTGSMERYTPNGTDPMPYNEGGTLTVNEFLQGSQVGWTDTDTMAAFNAFRGYYGKPVIIEKAFVEVGVEIPDEQQHYVGTAFVLRPARGGSVREMYRAAVECGAWAVVTPPQNGTITVDARYMPSGTFITKGFPTLAQGAVGNHTLFLQRVLNNLGFNAGTEDGKFGPNTEAAVRRMQNAWYLSEDGVVAATEWESILNHADLAAGAALPDGSGPCAEEEALEEALEEEVIEEEVIMDGDAEPADGPAADAAQGREDPPCGCKAAQPSADQKPRSAHYWG